MEMNEKDKQEYIKLIHKYEGENFDQIIKIQIQNVVRETARLIGLLEAGNQVLDIDSKEYKSIREFGSSFLHKLVLTGKELNVQLQ